MHHTPTPRDDRARRVVFAWIAAGAIAVVSAAVLETGRASLQSAALCFFAVGIFITTRYIFTSFSYSVEPRSFDRPDDGTVTAADVGAFHVRHLPPSEMDFVVHKSQGQRQGIIEARLSMAELTYFAPLPREGGRKREAFRLHPDMRVYNYTVSYRPEGQYIAVFTDSAENVIGVIFEPDGQMADYFADTAAKNGMK